MEPDNLQSIHLSMKPDSTRVELLTNPQTRPIILQFVTKLRGAVRKIDSALKADDLNLVSDEAHCLCGSSSSFGYPEISDIAAKLSMDTSSIPSHKLRFYVRALYQLSSEVEAELHNIA